MRTFFVLIFISFKLFASPIGDGKTMFSGKVTTVKEYQNSSHIDFLDQELTETEESEDDSTHTVSGQSSFSIQDFFALILKESDTPIWAFSSQQFPCKQLYKLNQNFRI